MTQVCVQESTMPYYEDRRSWLLFRILRSNTERLPVLHGLLLDELLWCERCLEVKEASELEIHHVNHDGNHSEIGGGWQRLYKHEEDFENGVALVVLCAPCHCEVDEHRRQLGLRTP